MKCIVSHAGIDAYDQFSAKCECGATACSFYCADCGSSWCKDCGKPHALHAMQIEESDRVMDERAHLRRPSACL